MNNAETLVTLSKYPNDPRGRTFLRRNNAGLFMQVIQEWFGSPSPLVHETLLTRCAEYARHFVPWRDDPDGFIRDCLERECRILFARSKMITYPSSEPEEIPFRTVNSKTREDHMEETVELAKIREEVCQKMGHLYHRADYVYARDAHRTAFKGAGWQRAAKYMRLYCARCTSTIEVEICPPLDVRIERKEIDKNKSLGTAA